METINETVYLKKSIFCYRTYKGLFGFALVISLIFNPLLKNYIDESILDLLIGLPMFSVLILMPIGLVCSLMSYKKQEADSKMRFRYLIRHLFALLIFFIIMLMLIKDITKLLE